MKIDRALIGALLIGILVLSPSAYAITISVGGDAGGFTENINAGDKDAVYSNTVIAANSLSHSIKGSGNLKESHWVSNSAGASAGVGVEIRKAESYSYDYYLMPGPGSFWPASRYPAVSASETLDVVNANYINAYASSFNAKGESAGVSTVLVDPGRKASLAGYSNTAAVTPDKVVAIQNAVSASAPGGSIQTKADSQLSRLRIFPLELRMEKTGASTTVKAGYVNGYIDRAAVLNHEIAVSQQDIDSASGKQINSQTKSTLYSATLFKGLRMFDAEAGTMTFGSLTGYGGISKASKDLVEAQQSGHVVGTFTSTAKAGSASRTRSSNYGHEYDLDMQAKKDASGSSATGLLGYYVDSDDLVANKIQGAVDASESGDTINVAGGTYYENVQIDKSLSIKGDVGSDPSTETVVDGQMNGSVFTIGKNDPNIEVSLQGMTIRNGSGTYMEMWPGHAPVQFGGGIWNQGTLSIISSMISGNTANGYGCGIWSTGNLTVESSSIEGNGKSLDGGGIWSSGNLTVDSSIISGNEAHWNGGGIWNSGDMILENSYVGENTANLYGGGVANDMGRATVKDSTISGNNATVGGGGVYNIFGTVSLEDSNVSWNNGNAGGGILNNGEMMVSGGSISNNNAVNGGGIFNIGTMELNGALVDNNTATENGGGVYNEGTAVVMDSTISGNTASGGGGIFNYFGTVNMDGVSITGNTASGGGGIENWEGTLNIDGGSITGNIADSYGGGIYSNIGTVNLDGGSITGNTAYEGGGIYSTFGTVNLDGGSITGNTAYKGGGIYNDYLIGISTVNLNNASSVSNNTAYEGGGIFNFGDVNLNGSYISSNNATYGGGIWNGGNLILNVSSIDHNTAEYGGGIYNEIGWVEVLGYYLFHRGIVNMDGGSIAGNTAHEGGGIENRGSIVNLDGGSISGNSAYWGGGVFNSGTATISGSSISGNSAVENGGGIFSIGTANVLENSTVTRNIADSDNDGVGTGGGIYWSDSILNFIDANGDGIVDPNTIVFDNYLGNGDVNNIEPPLAP